MLRAIQHSFLRPRVLRLKIDCTSGTPVASVGGEELSSITDNGTGDFTLTFKQAFRRQPLVIATPTDGSSVGSFCHVHTAAAASVRINIRPTAGAAEDTRCNIVLVGYDSDMDKRVLRQSLMSTSRNPRMIVGSVSSAGAATVNGGTFTVSKSSTGVYVVVPRVKFGYAPIVVASINQTTAGTVSAVSVTAASIEIRTYNAAGTPTDAAFSFLAAGSDAANVPTARVLRVAQEGNVAPRFVFIECASGNASVAVNSDAASVASGGTGIGNITLAAQNAAGPAFTFKRTPVCLATAESTSAINAYVSTAATTGCTVRTVNDAGTATASASHVLLFGWDSSIYYRSV